MLNSSEDSFPTIQGSFPIIPDEIKPGFCLDKSEAKTETEKSRYNLRRRKYDSETKPQRLEDTKEVTSTAVTVSTQLDFGGKIGTFLDAPEIFVYILPFKKKNIYIYSL